MVPNASGVCFGYPSGYPAWVAAWRGSDGLEVKRAFYIGTHGSRARQLAVEARKQAAAEMYPPRGR